MSKDGGAMPRSMKSERKTLPDLNSEETQVRAAAEAVARKATSGFGPPDTDTYAFQYKGHALEARQIRPGVVEVRGGRGEVLFPAKERERSEPLQQSLDLGIAPTGRSEQRAALGAGPAPVGVRQSAEQASSQVSGQMSAKMSGQGSGQSSSLNTIAPVLAPALAPKQSVDIELNAHQRAQATASVAANDKQADVKRELIGRMTAEELKQFNAAGTNKPQADQVLRGAAAREERAQATAPARASSPPLEERFNVTRRLLTKEYEFRDQPGKLAFSERFSTLRSESNAPAAAIAMMDRAGERGWATVRVDGSPEFKRQAWIAAEARGINAIGYEPTKGDIGTARSERQRLDREAASLARSSGTPAQDIRSPADHPPADRPRTDSTPGDRTPGAPATIDVPGVSGPGAGRQARATDGQPDPAVQTAQATQRDAAHGSAEPGHARNTDPANGERDADKRDRDGRGTSRSAGTAAFMLALEKVMERENVPQERRPEIRAMVNRELNGLRASGKTARVRIVDRSAPRVPQSVPQYEARRSAQERTR